MSSDTFMFLSFKDGWANEKPSSFVIFPLLKTSKASLAFFQLTTRTRRSFWVVLMTHSSSDCWPYCPSCSALQSRLVDSSAEENTRGWDVTVGSKQPFVLQILWPREEFTCLCMSYADEDNKEDPHWGHVHLPEVTEQTICDMFIISNVTNADTCFNTIYFLPAPPPRFCRVLRPRRLFLKLHGHFWTHWRASQ